MAIVIPSKNIYSINFDPVIDNQIDKVEVETITPSTVYDYDTIVFNKDYTNLGLYLPDNYDLKADSRQIHQDNTQGNWYYYAEAISFVNIRPAYTTVSIKVPKNQSNKLISKIYDKENIKYSLVLDEKETVPISVTVKISSSDGHPSNSNISYGDFNWDYNNRETTKISGIKLKDYLSVANTITVPSASGTSVQGISATASKTLANQENLGSTSVAYNAQDDTWDLLNLKILTAVYVVKTGENYYNKSSLPIFRAQTRTLNGTAEIYAAKQLSMTIYGDTINLDLQDKTVSIGNGNKVFSFDGNELIQTTNTPTQEGKYQEIIDEWKNGKQTATIACPIADFYDTNGNKVIDTSVSDKMLFGIGDIVIPYTYTNQGDKPISYNKNFTPKQFKVVGTKISKNQGGTQELTLQEV